jgi:hypothetical protein
LFTRATSLSALLNGLLAWAVLFPFIPSIVPQSDTQPTFLLLFLITVVVSFALPSVGARIFRVSFPSVTLVVVATLTVYCFMLAANAFQQDSTIPSRIFSFAQFAAAALWAYAGKYEWNNKTIYRAMLVYAVFTVIYFGTGGVIENVLIHSRASGSASLFETGRGARTLSPEPSFFALQIFNIYILSRLIAPRDKTDENRRPFYFGLVAFCLLSSFSAVGVLVLLVIVCVKYPRYAALITLIVISAVNVFYGFLLRFDSIRAVNLVLTLIKSNGNIAKLALLDASVSSRIDSFSAYVSAFTQQPWIGNGFSLLQGGGFISIIAGLGVLALAFFLWVLMAVLHEDFSPSTKVLLLFWLALNLVSGPIGVPIIGVIVGRILGTKRRQTHTARSPSRLAGGRPVLSS